MEGMEKQLTVVDILYKFLYEMESFEGFDPYSFNQEAVFKRAKELEKQQLGKFYNHGQWTTVHGDTFEDYYNKIFKSE